MSGLGGCRVPGVWTLVSGLCLAAMVGGPSWAATANRIVAIVNDDVITETDVAARLSAVLEAVADEPLGMAETANVRHAVLVRLIEEQLMLQEAKRVEVPVGAEEIADELTRLRRRFGSEEALRQSLIEAGLSKEQLKQQIREQLMVRKIIDAAVRATLRVSPHEVAQELGLHPEASEAGQLIEVSHMLIRVGEERSEEEARTLADQVAAMLQDGAEFAELARRHSDDPNAEQGGVMGWVGPGMLLPELDAHIFTMQEESVSAPIRTQLGFHIVQVGGRRTVTSMSALEAKRAVEQRLFQQKFDVAFDQWLKELKDRAYIEVR